MRIFKVISKNNYWYKYEGILVHENEYDLVLKISDVGDWESNLVFDKSEVEEIERRPIMKLSDEETVKLANIIKDLKEEIEKYRKEIDNLRGRAHLSCPACYEDCQRWIVDGKPCRDDWKL